MHLLILIGLLLICCILSFLYILRFCSWLNNLIYFIPPSFSFILFRYRIDIYTYNSWKFPSNVWNQLENQVFCENLRVFLRFSLLVSLWFCWFCFCFINTNFYRIKPISIITSGIAIPYIPPQVPVLWYRLPHLWTAFL